MALNSVESAIDYLTETVLELKNKVFSLEKTIQEQNSVIKKLISVSGVSSESVNIKNIDNNEGVRMHQHSLQPMADVNHRPKPAISVPVRSNAIAAMTPERTRVSASALASSPSESSSARARTQVVNNAPTTLKAQRVESENSTKTNDDAQGVRDEWVNVKPRRSRRRAETTDKSKSKAAVEEEVIPAEGSDINLRRRYNLTKNRKIAPINKGLNTAGLKIKAVERKKYLHVWRLLKDTTEKDITEYVTEILGENSFLTVTKIQHKTERGYSSFKIGVTEDNFDKLYNPSVWPKDTEYSEWVFFRAPKHAQQ